MAKPSFLSAFDYSHALSLVHHREQCKEPTTLRLGQVQRRKIEDADGGIGVEHLLDDLQSVPDGLRVSVLIDAAVAKLCRGRSTERARMENQPTCVSRDQ